MTFDYKKEYKEWYLPPQKPGIITVPKMQYVAVRGTGDPNESEGAYQKAMGILYGISYTIKMSWKGEHAIPGYFSYVVPPLEGLWKMPEGEKIDLTRKGKLCWISMIRLPEFVTEEVFEWAKNEAGRKKNTDVSKAEFFSYERDSVCSACTSDHMTRREGLFGRWNSMPGRPGISWTSGKTGCTMRFI